MKYFLTITLCSLVDGTCIGPHTFPNYYPDLYNCQIDGYQKSVEKIKEIGSDDINQYKIYTKFSCKILNET
tara:strand:+ start:129 stop:341 length:213 start_codon:yes stop_codon:yes gene_type:complete